MQGAEQKNIDVQFQVGLTNPDRKYSYQIGLRDLDFDVNEQLIKTLELNLPFRGIDQAEYALKNSAISITSFKEMDGTGHEVLIFDPRPIGYSGFMNCVKHSLAMTNHGLFEVGRYPAVSMTSESRFWQWFLHRRKVVRDRSCLVPRAISRSHGFCAPTHEG